MNQNGVTDDALRLYLFPYSLTHHATAWFDHLPKNSIHTFQEMASKFLSKYFPPSMVTKLRNDIHTLYNGLTLRHRDTINAVVGGTFMKRRPKECYDLIENMTAHHNDWDNSAHRGESSSSTTSSSFEIAALAQQMIEMRKDMLHIYRSNKQVNYVTHSCETWGGPYSYYECQATGGYTQDVYATTGNYNSCGYTYQPQGNHNLLSYRSINFLGPPAGPPVPPPTLSSSEEEVERDPEPTMDQVHILSPESTARVPPSVIQPLSFLDIMSFLLLLLLDLLRLNKEKLQDKSDIQVHKFLQMFKILHFNISLADALALI
ncbi:reverse transcriptase domain-containing protein, partial [Tanacetum coccineum]